MIRVQVDDRGVVEALARLSASMADMTPVMQDIGDEFVERIRAGFSASKAPWGDPWRPLSAQTQAMNNGRRRGGQPLRDTGQLMNSITSRASRAEVVVGSADEMDKVVQHQFGSGRVPARPFLPIRSGRADLPADWSQSIIDIVEQHLRGAL